MNRLRQTFYKQLIIAALFMCTMPLLGQEHSKTYQERFIVGDDAVLDINTSYADIEFETWDSEEIAITAVVTLEGATDEEADAYFKNDPIEMIGNTKKVSLSSRVKTTGFFSTDDLDIKIFDFPSLSNMVDNVSSIPTFPEVPPLPFSSQDLEFDYKAYKKYGDKYIKKWQKNFEKNFDDTYKKELEEWSKKVEEKEKELQETQVAEKRAAYEQRRANLVAARAYKIEAETLKEQEKELLKKAGGEFSAFFTTERDSVNLPVKTFFISNRDTNKSYTVKKTIKIKLPKSTRIKMDVRHGEVKLAEHTHNLDAKLSYASLWGTKIEGVETNVLCSYAPVTILNWNNGTLRTKYSNPVSLASVNNIQLEATSSEVVVEKILKNAYIKNSFGSLTINSFGTTFQDVDISLDNAELQLQLPKVASAIYIKGNASSLEKPNNLILTNTQNGKLTIRKGFHLNNNSNRSIIITSAYSDVVVK